MNKFIIASIIAIVVVVGSIVTAYNYLSYSRTTHEVEVRFNNVDKVSLYRLDEEIKQINTSGEKIRIESMNDNYYLTYEAKSGYSDGRVEIDRYTDKVEINPSYSNDRLKQIYDKEKQDIWKVIDSKYPDHKELYKPRNDRLYVFGQWFGVILDYKGKSYFNRDSVALVLHKNDDDKWQIITDPPLPSINIHVNPTLPKEVADDMNKNLFD